MTLGSSIFEVLTSLRRYPRVFPSISVTYEASAPLSAPITLLLDANGLHLRFDGQDQRLRLIEVLNFQKSRLTYNGGELAKAGTGTGGPTFRNIYNKLFGPTYPGEYIEMEDKGVYVLSYPGVAFSFPVEKREKRPDDFVSLLMGSNSYTAISMAIYNGSSWADGREGLFTKPVTSPRSPGINSAGARLSSANDEVELVRLHDDNKIELVRRHNKPFTITLHLTTPQELVAELGPPSAIYRKNDHRLAIHKTHSMSGRGGIQDDTDDTEAEDPPSDDDKDMSDVSATSNSDYFYNYFHHGIDIFISSARSSSHPVATKVILHGNIPGSFEFQRYRRSRWAIELADTGKKSELKLHSEMMFDEALPKLRERFGEGQRPMLLNRGSDSPSSSCELLGGWEDGDNGDKPAALAGKSGPEATFGNTELYGFPGFIFEVLKNRAVSSLTVF